MSHHKLLPAHILRSVVVWLIIIGAETVHGVVRTTVLAPRVGDLRARQIAVFTGSTVILVLAVAFAGWIGASGRRQLLGVGALWLALTLTFEIVFGRLVMGQSWERIASDYDPRQGGLLTLGMAVLLFAPLIAARIRRVTTSPVEARKQRPN